METLSEVFLEEVGHWKRASEGQRSLNSPPSLLFVHYKARSLSPPAPTVVMIWSSAWSQADVDCEPETVSQDVYCFCPGFICKDAKVIKLVSSGVLRVGVQSDLQ